MTKLNEVTEYHAFLFARTEHDEEIIMAKSELVEREGCKYRTLVPLREEVREMKATEWCPPSWAVPQTTPAT